MNASQFVAKWQPVELTERSAYQQHFLDLCELVEHPKPAELDPKGEFFTFERGVTKRTGRKGWADVWKKNHFAVEYKGKHKDLDAAYDQLLLYRGNLENPPLLVVCDMDRIIIRTNFTGAVEKKHEIPLEGLSEPNNLDILSWLFHDPEKLRPEVTREAITVQVAQRLANIANQMRERGLHAHAVARFLDRVVFCLFAEDVGLLPRDLFSQLIEKAGQDSKKFFTLVGQLFQAMATGGNFGLDDIRHFNGDLFDSTAVVLPTPDEMRRIKDAARLQWDQVDPSIFGTLFERGMDPDKRTQLGAHYTSREDIETVIEPVVMEPLRREWAVVQHTIENQLAGKGPKRKAKGKKPQTPSSLIVEFLQRLQAVTILDPACGSGNFLYVALQKLKDLEKEVLIFADDKGLGRFFPLVGPWQLHGIELNEYAFELAQVSIWIGYIQWHRANGYRTFHDPILRRIDSFECKDAILDQADPDHATEPDWPEVEFIVGNPPFLGGKKMKTELGGEYVDYLFSFWRNRVKPEADLCCYWFEKARSHIEQGKCKRAGLLATQAIRGGANRESLKRIKESGEIFFAVSDRNWILDGANVHVSMVGFDDGTETVRTLDGQPVARINSNLTAEADITQARRLKGNLDIAFMGTTKGGKFDIDRAKAVQLLRSSNPHRKPTSDCLFPWVNGLDITRRSRDMWIIDFGVSTTQADAALYEDVFEYVRQHVYPFRQKNKRESYKQKWWVHVEPRPAMRAKFASLSRFIITPRVAKHRLFTWASSPTMPDCQLFAFARSDDYTFGVLHSRVHEVWARAQGTQVRERESGFRYTPTTCFETFPLPEPAAEQREAIAQAAKRLDDLRTNWLNPPEMTRTEVLEFPGSLGGPWSAYVHEADERGIGIVRYPRKVAKDALAEKPLAKRTLTNLYNTRPTWLENAHRDLDESVFDSYGWESSMTDGAILEALLALNLEREEAEREAEAEQELEEDDSED
jgi:type II restriction/modification system DNA methylase subunit YeeA